jgi:hypothetical protein
VPSASEPIPPPVIVRPPGPRGARRPVVDPFERVDETPKKSPDVLNPY